MSGRRLSPAEAAARAAETRAGWLLYTPAQIVLFLAAVGPHHIVATYSVLKAGPYGGVEWELSGKGWFQVFLKQDIFDDSIGLADAHLSILWRSVWLAFLTTLLTLVVGFPTAWFIATRPERTRAMWLFLITIPFWTNLLIRTFAIMEIIRSEGVLNSILTRICLFEGEDRICLIDKPLTILLTDWAVLIGMTYVYLPLMVLPAFAAMSRFDFRLLEAGYDLYATRLQVLRRIVLPIVRPGLVAGSILVFVPALGAYVTPRVLGGGKNMMLGNLIELQFGQGKNWPLGAALSLMLLLIVSVALVFYVRLTTREDRNG